MHAEFAEALFAALLFLRPHFVNESGFLCVSLEITGNSKGLFDAVRFVPIRLFDGVSAKPSVAGHVGHAEGDIGIEEKTLAARFGIVATELENGIPWPGGLELAVETPESEGTFLDGENLAAVRIMIGEHATPTMNDGGKLNSGKGLRESFENNGIGESVANAGAGKDKDFARR